MAEEKDIKGRVNTTKYMVLPQAQATALGVGLTEYDPTNGDHVLKFAQLVKLVDTNVTLNASDLQLGAMEIKDGATDIRMTVVALSNSNAMATMLVDGNGDQITTFGGDAEAVPGTTAAAKVLQLGGIAESNIPDPVADGDTVKILMDVYGRLIMAGYNYSVNAMDVNIINPTENQSIGPLEQFTAQAANGAGSWVDVSNLDKVTVHFDVSGGATDVDLIIETSMDKQTSPASKTLNVTIDGYYELSLDYTTKVKYVRAAIDIQSGVATVAAVLMAGN